MRIAILSDIHGNDVALKSVIKEIDEKEIDKILLLGDYVGYYYNADIILNLIEGYENEMIRGNHEILMEQSLKNNEKSLVIKKKYGSGIEYAKKLLTSKQVNHLIDLPDKKKLEIDGLKIMICHGSPWNIGEYIYPDTPEETKKKCLKYDSDFVFIGHSHYSFIYKHNSRVLVNAGSVGQNRKVGGIANWGFLDTNEKRCVIKETYYNTKKIIRQAKKIDPEQKYLVEVLSRKKEEEHAK